MACAIAHSPAVSLVWKFLSNPGRQHRVRTHEIIG
jgi:hypothetical protein